MFVNVDLPNLPLDILLEIAKLHPWVGCELSKAVRKVGLYSLENDMKRWYRVERNNETFIRVKSSNDLHYEKDLRHSWDDAPAVTFSINYGTQKRWYKEGNLHRDDDKPAVINSDGIKEWHTEGNLHRNDKPKLIYPFDRRALFKNGRSPRDNYLSDTIRLDGDQWWYKNGKLHREDDKPALICSNGIRQWWKEGEPYYPE